MSITNTVYEDLKEYVEVINARIRELDDELAQCEGFTYKTKIKATKETYENVENELERILDGRGL